MIDFEFTADLWLWKAGATWHFVTVPDEPSAAFKAFAVDAKKGFGSVRVHARIGGTEWKTSLFPSKEHAAYLLPVKKAVREAEELKAGSTAIVSLSLPL